MNSRQCVDGGRISFEFTHRSDWERICVQLEDVVPDRRVLSARDFYGYVKIRCRSKIMVLRWLCAGWPLLDFLVVWVTSLLG